MRWIGTFLPLQPMDSPTDQWLVPFWASPLVQCLEQVTDLRPTAALVRAPERRGSGTRCIDVTRPPSSSSWQCAPSGISMRAAANSTWLYSPRACRTEALGTGVHSQCTRQLCSMVTHHRPQHRELDAGQPMTPLGVQGQPRQPLEDFQTRLLFGRSTPPLLCCINYVPHRRAHACALPSDAGAQCRAGPERNVHSSHLKHTSMTLALFGKVDKTPSRIPFLHSLESVSLVSEGCRSVSGSVRLNVGAQKIAPNSCLQCSLPPTCRTPPVIHCLGLEDP